MELWQARALADQLIDELRARNPEIEKHVDYYRGRHPLRFASKEFRRYFEEQYRGFADNWVQPVADAPVERLTVIGVKPAGDVLADVDLWSVWQRNGLDADSQLGFTGAGIGARCFVLVWGNPDNPDMPEVTFEDARQAIVAYEPGSRRKRRAALKVWQDGSHEYATLYLPDEVWKLQRPVPGTLVRKALALAEVDDLLYAWQPVDRGEGVPNPQPNPLGMVPMVELPNRPLLADDPLSDVSGVIAMQDSVNLLWAQLFTASDQASFPARVMLGQEPPKTPILDKNGQKVGERPVPLEKFAAGRVMFFGNKEARIGSWPAADLKAYTDVIEVGVGHIAAQTRTPPHYLIGRMVNMAGDALLAAENGLIKRTEEKQLWYGQALREVFQLIALARGEQGRADAVAAGEVLWADAESRNTAQLADALLKLKQIGFPFEWLAARYGLTPTEVADLMAMREREAEADPVSALIRPKPDPILVSMGGGASSNPEGEIE